MSHQTNNKILQEAELTVKFHGFKALLCFHLIFLMWKMKVQFYLVEHENQDA